MFEYLMPLLVMRSYPDTLLDADLPDGRARARCDYGAGARRAVGHLGVGLQPRRPRTAPTSTRPSACPASA